MSEDRPNIKVLPPLVYLGGIVATFILQAVIPLTIFVGGAPVFAGLVMMVAGFVPGFLALRRMWAAGTNPDPTQASTAVVSDGPFRYSRNPIYVGFAIILVGFGLLMNSWWFVPVLVVVIFVINTQVITYEEAYLEHKFGDEYRQYKARVRRWI